MSSDWGTFHRTEEGKRNLCEAEPALPQDMTITGFEPMLGSKRKVVS
jgi:hypothetical protein